MNGKYNIKLLFVSLAVLLFLIVGGCATNPPYKLDSGEQVILTKGDGSVSCSYQELLNKVDSLLDDVLPHTKERSSGIDAMVMLHNGLEDMGIKTALIATNVQGNEPFYTCIAVETTDKGMIILDLFPQSLGTGFNIDRSEYVQAVYLQKGQKIGLVEAKYAQSNSYSWYLEYLERFYYVADFAEYLAEYESVVEKNNEGLDNISKEIDEITSDLENFKSWTFSWTDQTANEFNRLVDALNEKNERYNRNIVIFNAQVEDCNADLDSFNKLAEDVQDIIYYVKEDRTPNLPIALSPLPLFVMPPLVSVPVSPSYFNLYPSLSQINDSLLRLDDSYNQIPKPNRQSVKKFERVTDENFIVEDFKLWW
jgi:uncharacterized protein YoxC